MVAEKERALFTDGNMKYGCVNSLTNSTIIKSSISKVSEHNLQSEAPKRNESTHECITTVQS